MYYLSILYLSVFYAKSKCSIHVRCVNVYFMRLYK